MAVESWSYEGAPAFRLISPHYTLFTTIPDRDYATHLSQVMEAAITQYAQLTPHQHISTDTMNCYVFDHRKEWVDFTKRNTGAIAPIYLQINRGGYTLRDWYVSYDIGSLQTYAVAAHEGWHQFAFRNFIGRLPPFLEEGIACSFENVQVKNDLPTFDLTTNPQRSKALRKAIETHQVIPLSELITLHAGQIVSRAGNTIETWYAEDWAFARFLMSAENGRYRPAFLRLIDDTANGQVVDPSGGHRLTAASWDPAAVAPLLEYYLQMNMDDLSKHYQAYIRDLAYDQIDD